MNWLIFVLTPIVVVANFVMDELHTHYERFFQKIIPEKWQDWWDPSLSWDNKKYIEGSEILTFIFSTFLSFLTDAWHFFKMIFLTSAALIILLLENDSLKWWQYGVELLVVGLVWGFIWELTNGIIGAISNKLKNK